MSDSRELQIIGELLEEFLSELRAGRDPDIEQFVSRNPVFGDRIRHACSAMLMLEHPPESEPAATTNHSPVLKDQIPSRVGEFEIVRELGRGGMGLVFEAFQRSLDRSVALKILRWGSGTESSQTSRFLNEAQAAARLHHTNIVPVFQVGECDGIHFYAMQLINGAGLDSVITSLQSSGQYSGSGSTNMVHAVDVCKTNVTDCRDSGGETIGPNQQSSPDFLLDRKSTDYFRQIAQIICDAANALDYAHQCSVLHRDIKPANLLVDDRGHVWLADFGLAKLDDSGLTQTGQVVGTVRYMAPERLQGVDDTSCDIYSLGVTLFEMLTLHAAFDESDRAALIGRLIRERLPDPRKLEPRIPPDLAIIARKSTAREPSLRYSSARDFANDLKRFVNGQPISARESSTLQNAMLWSKRNPVMATLISAVMLLSLVLTVGSIMSAINIESKNREISGRLDKEKELRRVATSSLMESSLVNIRALPSSIRPGRSRDRHKSIETALGLLDSVPDANTSHLDLRNMAIDTLVMFDVLKDFEVSITERFLNPDNQWDFSSDLSWIAGIDREGNLVLNSTDGSGTRGSLKGQWAYARTRISRNNQYVAVYGVDREGKCRVEVWNRKSDQKSLSTTGTTDGGINNKCSFDHRGIRFAYIDVDGNIRVVELPDGKEIRLGDQLEPHAEWVEISPDGRSLLFAQQNEAVHYSIEHKRELGRFVHNVDVRSGCWSSLPGILATAGSTGTIYVWDSEAPSRPAIQCAGHTSYVDSICFHNDGEMMMSSSSDGTTRFWSNGKLQLLTSGGGARFSNDGASIGFFDPEIAWGRWKINGTLRRHLGASNREDARPPFCLSISQDEKLAAWSAWRKPPSICHLESGVVSTLDESGFSGSTTLFTEENGQSLLMTGTEWGVAKAALSMKNENRVVTRSGFSEIASFTTAGQKLFSMGPRGLLSIPNSDVFYHIGADDLVSIVETDWWCGAADYCLSRDLVAVSSKSEPVVLFYRGSELQEKASPRPQFTLQTPHEKICVPRMGPRGKWLALSWSGGCVVMAIPDAPDAAPEIAGEFQSESTSFCRVAFSANGEFLATTTFDKVTLFRVAPWQAVAEFSAPPGSRFTGEVLDMSSGIAFANDDQWLLANTMSNSLVVWDLERIREALQFRMLDW